MNDHDTIAEFQRMRREFQPLWTRAVGFIFLPGFVLLAAGAIANLRWLAIPGVALCMAGAARGGVLILRYRRCPVCNAVQPPRLCYPYRACRGCGSRLSMGAKDSS